MDTSSAQMKALSQEITRVSQAVGLPKKDVVRLSISKGLPEVEAFFMQPQTQPRPSIGFINNSQNMEGCK